MIGAKDCRFDVGDEGVHPLEQTDLAGLARADDDRSVFGHTGPGGIQAGQPIGDQVNTLVQGRSGPFSHGVPFEVINGVESDLLGIPLVIEFHRRNEPSLVLGTTSRLARHDPTQIGVVGQHHASKDTAGLALGHRFEQFVLDPPSRAVRHPEVTFQRQRGIASTRARRPETWNVPGRRKWGKRSPTANGRAQVPLRTAPRCHTVR